MIPVQIRINKKMVDKIDQLVEAGVYSNRSEVIRDATRRLVIEMSGKNGMKHEMRFFIDKPLEVKRNV
jgi:Arc/MetJ-type ribon-helix-helix transcriptional regulator